MLRFECSVHFNTIYAVYADRLVVFSKDINTPKVLRIAVAVSCLAFCDLLEHLLVFLVQHNILKVGDDTRGCHRLGDDTRTALTTPCNENVGIGAVVLLCNLSDLSKTSQRGQKCVRMTPDLGSYHVGLDQSGNDSSLTSSRLIKGESVEPSGE